MLNESTVVDRWVWLALRGSLAALVLALTPGIAGGQTGLCGWPAAKVGAAVNGSNGFVDWASDYSIPGAGVFNVSRAVINKDSIARDIYWEVGRIQVRPLAPHQAAILCRTGTGVLPVTGVLYFGRDRNSRMSTNPFAPALEPADVELLKSRPLTIDNRLIIRPEDAKSADIGIEIGTKVTLRDGRYAIEYSIRNVGQRDVRVGLHGLPKDAAYLLDLVQPRTISVSSPLSKEVLTDDLPLATELTLTISDLKTGKLLAQAGVGSYVSASGW